MPPETIKTPKDFATDILKMLDGLEVSQVHKILTLVKLNIDFNSKIKFEKILGIDHISSLQDNF